MNEMTNSHILVHQFDYFEPASLGEAIALLAQYGERARLLAGGTDLLVQMKMERTVAATRSSASAGSPGWIALRRRDGQLHIGARATIRAIETRPARPQAPTPRWPKPAPSFSTTQVQTMGTVGGNLGNGSPASDSAPALIALGRRGRDRRPRRDTAPAAGGLLPRAGQDRALQDGELLTDVVLPRPRARHRQRVPEDRPRGCRHRQGQRRGDDRRATATGSSTAAWPSARWRRRRCARAGPSSC